MNAIIECPRCGFAQPKDRFCASCGVDMMALMAQRPPFRKRILQNPNTHLSLIALLIAGAVGFIVVSQSELVTREMETFLGTPLSSKEAGEPSQDSVQADPTPAKKAVAVKSEALQPEESAQALVNDAESAQEGAGATEGSTETKSADENALGSADAPKEAASQVTKLELTYWEVPREAVNALTAKAEKDSTGDPNAFLFKSADELTEQIKESGGEIVGIPKTSAIDTPIQTQSPPHLLQQGFLFSLIFQMTDSLRWELSHSIGGAEAVNQTASVPLAKGRALMLILDIPVRTVAPELLKQTGEGPWNIFSSPEFKVGMSDWIAVVSAR